ncbi:MAG: DUF1049 domain-containing protein [Myxococcales bacterium]|jgi:hypothetical protein|nr:DUF1049 domain-containing protein [Myxococcales bacterium]
MTAAPPRRKRYAFWIAFWVLLVLALFLFAASNAHWVSVYFPAFPWSRSHAMGGFETQVFALIAVSTALGVVLGLALLWPFFWRHRRLLQQARAQVQDLGRALEKTERLVAHSQQRKGEDA